jgi:8-oxo-dGTP pyrophosphatase MutT (NUDIX family)
MTTESALPARHAASLLLLKFAPDARIDATEVLMGLRNAGHKFMPNRLVFPGGGVDAEDATAEIAEMPAPGVLARLAAGGTDPRGLVHAAARELVEETGLHLGVPPNLARLDYLCRAITPVGRPIRFDARFLLIDATNVQGELSGSGELEDLRWYGLAEALALDLAFPTRAVLEQLRGYLALTPDERSARTLTPTMRDRSWALE